jgi:hypothetical protein
MFVRWPTKENIKFLLAKAFNSAKAIENKISIPKEEVKTEVKTEEKVENGGAK